MELLIHHLTRLQLIDAMVFIAKKMNNAKVEFVTTNTQKIITGSLTMTLALPGAAKIELVAALSFTSKTDVMV